MEVRTKCDKKLEEAIHKNVCLLCKELGDFSTDFQNLIKIQKKEAEKLWVLVVRYNALLMLVDLLNVIYLRSDLIINLLQGIKR